MGGSKAGSIRGSPSKDPRSAGSPPRESGLQRSWSSQDLPLQKNSSGHYGSLGRLIPSATLPDLMQLVHDDKEEAVKNGPMGSDKCAIFWDFENCPPPSGMPGYYVVEQIRRTVHHFGTIHLFKVPMMAYLQITETTKKSMRSELQSSGVSLTDTPHNARKDAADKMILVDMLAYAIDNPPPATIVLISGDRDFVYALATLRNRRYNVVVIVPNRGAPVILTSQANAVLEWRYDVLHMDLVQAEKISPTKPLPSSPSMDLAQVAASASEEHKKAINNKVKPAPSDTKPQVSIMKASPPTSADDEEVESDLEQQRRAMERIPASPLNPGYFDLLVEIISAMKMSGGSPEDKPKKSKVASELLARNPLLLQRADLNKVDDYFNMAKKAGLVVLGGSGTDAWVNLNDDFVTRF